MKGISIVICCFNSALRIAETLRYISEQKVLSDVLWEVIIINNNSSDNTKEVASKTWKDYNLAIPFSIIDESASGLSFARVRGFESAKYDVIIFCDDDNWLDKNYVQRSYEVMDAQQDIGVLGGNIEPVCESKSPYWFEEYKYNYAVGKQGYVEGNISERYYVWGAGMVIRKKIWTIISEKKFTSLITDRKGSQLSAGGDSELCMLCLILGYKLWYSPDLVLKHFIPFRRLQWKYVKKMVKGFGAAEAASAPLRHLLSIKMNQVPSDYKLSWRRETGNVLLLLIRHPKKVIKGLIGREGTSDPLWLNYYFSCLLSFLQLREKLDVKFIENHELFQKEINSKIEVEINS